MREMYLPGRTNLVWEFGMPPWNNFNFQTSNLDRITTIFAFGDLAVFLARSIKVNSTFFYGHGTLL